MSGKQELTVAKHGSDTAPDYAHLRLRPEALDLLAEKKQASAFLQAALASKMYKDAFDFITQWLPRRQLVWWGCLCCWQALRPQPADEAKRALRAALKWVMDPTELNRRGAERAGYAADIVTPAGNIALAAYLSSGSLAPPGQPEVAPQPEAAGQAIANAMTLLLARIEPDRQDPVRADFIQLAIDIHDGKLVWTKSKVECESPPPPPIEEVEDEDEDDDEDVE